MDILFPVLLIGGMGLVFGALLAYAAKIFYVKTDERVPKIIECLPGANCGGCGFAGCSAYAEAIAKGEAKPNCCPSGGAAAAEKIAAIMGIAADEVIPKVARVMCGGTKDCAKTKFIYGEKNIDCHAAMKLGGGAKSCAFGCLGLGSCAAVCDNNAISIKNGVAVIDREKCGGCGKCVRECPKNVIDLVRADVSYAVSCKSRDKGKKVRAICESGCIGCGLCAKVCLAEAITLENNLAAINPEKCANCGMCAEKCPQKAISFVNVPDKDDLESFVRI